FFSCSGRKLLLGTQTGEEYKILRSELGLDIPVVGFYGYGEIGPGFEDAAKCQFHNETFVTVLIGA
ncbi:MAG: FIST C-terminal domain-containing protein, partial [Hyphomicrobiaceae bacterium]